MNSTNEYVLCYWHFSNCLSKRLNQEQQSNMTATCPVPTDIYTVVSSNKYRALETLLGTNTNISKRSFASFTKLLFFICGSCTCIFTMAKGKIKFTWFVWKNNLFTPDMYKICYLFPSYFRALVLCALHLGKLEMFCLDGLTQMFLYWSFKIFPQATSSCECNKRRIWILVVL